MKNYVFKSGPEDRVFKKGLILEKEGKYKEALILYEEEKNRQEKDADASSSLLKAYARALFMSRSDPKTCIILEDLSAHDPAGCMERLLATCYLKTAQFEKSEKAHKALLKKFPKESASHLNAIGESLKGQGDDVGARGYFELALSKSPDNKNIKGNLAQVLIRAGQEKKALPMLKELATQSGADTQEQYRLAEGYILSGDKARATTTLSRFMSEEDARLAIEKIEQNALKKRTA
jgi:predicted Zn-dependent protease